MVLSDAIILISNIIESIPRRSPDNASSPIYDWLITTKIPIAFLIRGYRLLCMLFKN